MQIVQPTISWLYIKIYLSKIDIPLEHNTFEDEIGIIKAVQDVVLNRSPRGSLPIKCGISREVKSVYISRLGSCVERSRVIEKILRYVGFKTRHIGVFSIAKTNSSIKSLLTEKIPSHSVTEVLTKRGWIVVDPNYRWIAIDYDNNYLSIKDIKLRVQSMETNFYKSKPAEPIFTQKFVYIYGLYSRHGKFYPPYNFVPDIEWSEFTYNITEYFDN